MITVRREALIQFIVARLNADSRTGGQTIDVEIDDGDVVLVGSCDSDEQRMAAVTIAKGTCGVEEVVDHIQVRISRSSI